MPTEKIEQRIINFWNSPDRYKIFSILEFLMLIAAVYVAYSSYQYRNGWLDAETYYLEILKRNTCVDIPNIGGN